MGKEEFKRLYQTTGWSLIPLKGKRPIERQWQRWCHEKRPFDPKEFQGRNAGIPTGPGNGIIAIDVDDADKFTKTLQDKGWKLPITRRHKTGGGGFHYIYSYPDNGTRYVCRSFKSYGFDVRADGGQIVAPGSIHPETAKFYTVDFDEPIAPAPQWLLDLARADDSECQSKDEDNGTGARVDLDSLPLSLPVKELIKRGAPNGERSEAVFSVLQALIKAGIVFDTIRGIFETYPIGGKYREKGQGRERWLQGEIERARAKMGMDGKAKGPKALTLTDLEGAFSMKVEWIWRKNFPAGQPAILNGREGIGKTTIAMVAAKEILDTHRAGAVVWLATEGKVLDCVNKMKAIGLTDRFYVGQKSDGTFKFNFQWRKDLEELDTVLASVEQPVLAVFIDSIRGMTSLGDNEDKVGGVMHKVNALTCDKYHAALIYIDHWTKGRKDDLLDRNVGTTAKTAAVSAVLSVIKRTAYTRDIRVAKSNIGEIPDLISIRKGDQVVISQPFEESTESLATKAESFLLRLGEQKNTWPASQVEGLANNEGLNMEIIHKVKRKLGIQSQRNIDGYWEWVWPI